MRSVRRVFAVPFVLTVACGGKGGGGVNEPSPPTTWNVYRRTATECEASSSSWSSGCPKGAMCNPPPPRSVVCPEQLGPEPGTSLQMEEQADGGCAIVDRIGACDPAGTCTYKEPVKLPCPVDVPPTPEVPASSPPDAGA